MSTSKTTTFGVPYKSCNEIRSDFIKFFEDKAHKFIPSSNIAPLDDPTLLFTNAGMNQFKALFLGDNRDGLKRAVNTQKCLRVSGKHNDLDEVGRDGTHHTFFEMLGNWSFGDYYKKEAITWAWELLTDVWKLPKDRLFATVYLDDDEAHKIWETETDINPRNILRFDKDNFWEMGAVGPCGPCSEIHFDMGDMSTQEQTFSDPVEGVNGENQRYIEIWNLVFMQFERLKDSSLQALKATHVDTGSGFERICSVIQGKTSNYETDVFEPIIKEIAEKSQVPYSPGESGVPHRVIADHLRALSFTIADGVTPGNEGRGYVMRRILRRASRFAHSLGQSTPFIHTLVATLASHMGEAFPELKARQEYIARVIESEEARFLKTLDKGLARMDKLLAELKKKKKKVIPGKDAFLFHDTYGFPFDLTSVIAEENDFEVDRKAYLECMEEQKERARKSAKFDDSFASDEGWVIFSQSKETEFVGYSSLNCETSTLRYKEDGDSLYILLEKSPFYAEAGGQVGDIGLLENSELSIRIEETFKVLDYHVHKGSLIKGLITESSMKQFTAKVDEVARAQTKRNHSATHILHSALRKVLGDHVEQQGSHVGPARLRFDFTHHSSLSNQQLESVEDWINTRLQENATISTETMPIDEAKSKGAMALFGEKYGDTVRVLSMGDFSIELCGGTHAKATGDIGVLRIVSESSIAAGVRRIEAITGAAALDQNRKEKTIVAKLSKDLKAKPEAITERVSQMSTKLKALEKELAVFKAKETRKNIDDFISKHSQEIGDFTSIVGKLDSKLFPKESLQDLTDSLAERFKKQLAVLSHVDEGQLAIIAVVGKEALPRVKAGELVKELSQVAGGRGGGRPDKARAGSKFPEKEKDVLSAAKKLLSEKLA
ncbi:MAG: alanine--tRNA ligase [Oligoflexales bacterium]|nr:alanine--tRNA ligase [Oligoflexales bacterium]